MSSDDKIPAGTLHSDHELFRLIAGGDEAAFRIIFYRYGPILHPFTLDIVKNEAIAREIIQETFLRLWLKRETLAEIEKPSSWLYRIASNLALTHYRREQLERKVLLTVRDQSVPVVHTDSEPFRLKELQGLIHRATSQLSPLRKKIFLLSREEGLSRKEIADRLRISENTVKNQLGIAVRSIQAFIEHHSGIYIPFFLLLSLSVR